MENGINHTSLDDNDVADILSSYLKNGFFRFITCIIFFCFGAPANIYVLYRLRKFAQQDREHYKNGAGLGLFVMSISDLICLLTLLLRENIHLFIHLFSSIFDTQKPTVVDWLICKVRLFHFS